MERNHSLQLQFALCFSHFNHCSARVKSLHTSQHLPCKPSQQPAKAITRRFSVQHCVPFGAQFHIATARNHLATNQGLNHSSLATRSYQKAANRFLGMCDYCLTSSVCFFLILPFLLLLYASVFYSVKIIKIFLPSSLLTQLLSKNDLAKISRCGNDYFVNQCLSVMVQSKYLLKHLKVSSQ